MTSDESLILDFQEGKLKALWTVFDMNLRKLLYMSIEFTGSAREALILVSQVFVLIANRRKDYTEYAQLDNMIDLASRNQYFDYGKSPELSMSKNAKTYGIDFYKEYPSRFDNPVLFDEISLAGQREALYIYINRLPSIQLHIIKSLFLEAMPSSNIAEMLELTAIEYTMERNAAIDQLISAFKYNHLIFFLMLIEARMRNIVAIPPENNFT